MIYSAGNTDRKFFKEWWIGSDYLFPDFDAFAPLRGGSYFFYIRNQGESGSEGLFADVCPETDVGYLKRNFKPGSRNS